MLFLDNEPLTEGLSPINTTINNRISYTYQELVNHRFTWKDNGKKLRCVLQHDALGSNDQKEATIDLDISCEYNFPYIFIEPEKRERMHKKCILHIFCFTYHQIATTHQKFHEPLLRFFPGGA